MIAWLLGPIGRWFGAAGAVVAGVMTVYLKGRQDAKDKLRQIQAQEDNRRLRNAIEADVRARERFARGELRHDDGHRRD
jgi:uncharacterized membrane protein